VRKLAAPLVISSLAVVLMGAEVAASASQDVSGPHIFTAAGLILKLTSSMPGVTFSGNSLVCPPLEIRTSSGENLAACDFTISSTGAVAPASLTVAMTVSGIGHAEAAAHKFAIAPQPGLRVYFQTTPQTIYTLTGADLPVTLHPGVVWGANAGTALDNSDLNATIVVTYTVAGESLQGATASPVASGSEVVEGATATPGGTSTPPPTASASVASSGPSAPTLALVICCLLGGLALIAAEAQRRRVRR
jgi:hypothetical protein